ncbi:MAG: glycogen/starch synthase [Pirellulaceae bacterium]
MDRVRSVMTIHNLAYQGRFWHVDMPLTGLDWQYFNFHQMEFHGELNLMKTGIAFANTVTTVSPTYAREITLPEFGCGLEASLKARGDQLVGIVNGVDYAQWNPKTDQHLPANYSVDDWQVGKAQCKHALQQELGLEVDPALPLIGIVSRLADQKGWDLIIPLLEHWVTSRDVQWAILGTGDPHYEAQLRQLAQQAPHRLALRLEFSEQAAHRIEAACDMFLMPSRYEPCGLNQLYSLKYGSVPVVHTTGGLADTVRDASPANLLNKSATGFRFDDYSLVGLERAVNKAVDSYLHNQPQWAQIVETGMRDDWSWEQSASATWKSSTALSTENIPQDEMQSPIMAQQREDSTSSEMRHDWLADRWVIMAPQRSARPNDYVIGPTRVGQCELPVLCRTRRLHACGRCHLQTCLPPGSEPIIKLVASISERARCSQ